MTIEEKTARKMANIGMQYLATLPAEKRKKRIRAFRSAVKHLTGVSIPAEVQAEDEAVQRVADVVVEAK